MDQGVSAAETMYRAMKEGTDGFPMSGRSARTLGVRVGGPHSDIPVDSREMVQPNTGGMSVVLDDPRNLPFFRCPRSLGGGGRDPVFAMNTDQLPTSLLLRRDEPPHCLVEPRVCCRITAYEEAIESTRPLWRKTHE